MLWFNSSSSFLWRRSVTKLTSVSKQPKGSQTVEIKAGYAHHFVTEVPFKFTRLERNKGVNVYSKLKVNVPVSA